jgi:dienelactone hydrolase
MVRQRDKCNVIQMAASMYGLNVLALHIQDAQAALDVLAARPEVDAGRIGCLGNSYGGRTTMWSTIFDERITACVASGSMNTFRERSSKLTSCSIQYLYGLLRYGDVPELFSLIAPRPMQLQAGEKDGLINAPDRDMMVRTVRQAYQLLGAEDRFDYVQHPEGHLLLWEPARAFLEKHL